MEQTFGDRPIIIGREVSKVHEEFLRGTIHELTRRVAEQSVKGEITIVVHGATGEPPVSEEELKSEIRRMAAGGMRIKEISELIGERYHISKREVYRLALQVRNAK